MQTNAPFKFMYQNENIFLEVSSDNGKYYPLSESDLLITFLYFCFIMHKYILGKCPSHYNIQLPVLNRLKISVLKYIGVHTLARTAGVYGFGGALGLIIRIHLYIML